MIDGGLSVRQTEEAARRMNDRLPTADRRPLSAGGGQRSSEREMPAATRALEEDFRRALGTKVQVFRSRKGGKIVLHFYSEEELEAIYTQIVGKR